MELLLKNTSLFLAVFLTGLSAGLFYAWEVSVIPGTKFISDKNYLEVMQSINRAILNPGFFIIFLGSFLLLLSSTFLQYRAAVNLSFWLLLVATVTYLICMGVTAFGNVPLNQGLDSLDLNKLGDYDLINQRNSFEAPWNLLHTFRTVCAVVSFAAVLLGTFLNQIR